MAAWERARCRVNQGDSGIPANASSPTSIDDDDAVEKSSEHGSEDAAPDHPPDAAAAMADFRHALRLLGLLRDGGGGAVGEDAAAQAGLRAGAQGTS